jgi:DHA1 family multidrug resistance protein-like MFS transporter
MLFVSRILGGILSSATIPAAMAYIGDSTTAKERGGGMGIIGAAMGLGMVLGPGLGGWFAKGSLAMPFFIAAALSVLSMVLIVVALPESLPQEQRSRISITGQIFQFGNMWELLFGPFGFLLVLAFLVSFGLTNFEAVFGLFAIKRYGYGPERVGSVLAIIGLISAVMQGTLSGPLSRRWGEAKIIEISLSASAVGFVLMLQAETFRGVLATVSFFMISNALLRPAVSSLLSQQAGHSQGKIMGISNAYMSLGRIAGPACAGFLFEINISYPYLSGASIMLIGFLAGLRFLRHNFSRLP